MNLNLGCGHDILPGWRNVDARPGLGVDLIRDLDRPYALHGIPTASVLRVRAMALFEHLFHWEALMLEIARVLEPGTGMLDLLVPLGVLNLAPYHVRIFGPNTFDPYLSDVRSANGSCEFDGVQYFTKWRGWTEHYFPFSWHLARRFGRKVYALPLTRPHNLYLELRRNERPWRDGA